MDIDMIFLLGEWGRKIGLLSNSYNVQKKENFRVVLKYRLAPLAVLHNVVKI